MRVILTLPAYNEERSLPGLLEDFRSTARTAGFQPAVVVVDDGSTDETRRVLEAAAASFPLDLVVHSSNCGLGPTIRDGLQRAAQIAGANDVIVTMDADNTHPPGLIPEMLEPLRAGYDVVIASRFRRGAKVTGLSPLRHLMSWGARILYTLAFPIPGVRDYTSGFRAYRPEILQQAFATYGHGFVTESGFASMAEILLKLCRMGARVCEVPLLLRYEERGKASKMRVARTVAATLRLMLRLRWRRFD